ncbi:septal ring lytic transglycosylase RlpA family protein [Corticibacter populi]|uniref:Endolytic peptidoglycan transglycosylase RlpA n=2 Tax=Corticibacter populi TaxID=1550736 RepID=A0A3M6QKL2_9BURK|nr:septal ring lytic transglycosylase RlpA family protein [Corticibacter populi]
MEILGVATAPDVYELLTPRAQLTGSLGLRASEASINARLIPGFREWERRIDETVKDLYQTGTASWYGDRFHGRSTANGERYNMNALTAAHRSLPFGTEVCVRGLLTGREVLVRINDRGPYSGHRIIDLSRAAAERLGMVNQGLKDVALWIPDEDDPACGDGETALAGLPDAGSQRAGGTAVSRASSRQSTLRR